MKYINSLVFSLGLAVAIPAVVMADMAIHEGLAKRSNPSTTTQSSSTQTPSTTTYGPATQTPYGQCGGVGYTGPIICPPGWSCNYANEYHSQCLQATASSTTSSSSSSTSSSIVSSTSPPGGSSTSSPTSTSTSPPISSSSTTTTTTGLPSRAYAQCNGIGYTGPTTCPPGWSCHEANVYVWQCLIGTITSTSTTTTSILPTQTPYGQCGGIGYTGLITCAPGWTCNHLNAYFFQCVPS